MADRTGEQFGNYRLLRLIGRGGFADVYLGEHIYLRTQAALKILQVRLADNTLETFLREAQIVVQLEHPHIVRVLECGVEHDVPFLVMSYASGGSLRQRVPPGTSLPPTLVSTYITQIASALQYAHEHKFIHRDVKPENMLLNQDNQLLLSDFGLVLLTQSTGSQTTKEMSGTIPYMAPEQLQGKPRAASDQYALGIVTYELLSGNRPFEGTFVEVASQHLLSEPPPLYERIPSLSRQVEQVVLTALAKKPEERFASVQAFANALAQAVNPTLTDNTLLKSPINAKDLEQTADSTYITYRRAQTPPGSVFTPPDSPTTITPDKTPQSSNPPIPQPLVTPVIEETTFLLNQQPASGVEDVPTVQRPLSQNTPVILPQVHPLSARADTEATYVVNRQSVPQSTRRRPRSLRTLSIVLITLFVLFLLISMPVLIARSFSQAPQDSGSNSKSSNGSHLLTSPTATATASLNATQQTDTPTPSPTLTTPTSGSDQQTPFTVSNVTASVSPSNFHGTCSDPMTFTFTGTISVPSGSAGGAVTYYWFRSDGATGSAQTVSFSPGTTTQTVSTTWQLGAVWGDGTTFWEAIQVTSPNSIASEHANFSFVCQSQSPEVTSINASVSPGSYTCSKSQVTFNFSGTITLSSNPNGVKITYVWSRSDGATMSPITVSVPAGQTSVTVTDTWTLFQGVANGTYWERVDVSSPNSFSSNEASFTVSC